MLVVLCVFLKVRVVINYFKIYIAEKKNEKYITSQKINKTLSLSVMFSFVLNMFSIFHSYKSPSVGYFNVFSLLVVLHSFFYFIL